MKDRQYIFNQYLTEIQANIISAEKIDDNYHILLDKTIFYPAGLGGQKGDIGTINGKDLIKSYEKNSRIYHVVKNRIDSDSVLLKINWENRLHIMQEHTCQHLVSACFYRLYAIDTLSFHASDDHITIDFDTEDIEERQIKEVENLANFIIQNNLEVKAYFPSDKELENLPLRREPKVEKDLRIIEIDGFDYSPCGGTHVSRTGELGLIKIVDWAKQNGKLRVFVKVGRDALEDYRVKDKIYKNISKDLSANTNNLLEKYTSFKEKNQSLEEAFGRLKSSYLDLYAAKLLKQAGTNPKNFYSGIFDDLDFSQMNLLIKKLENENIILALYKYENEICNFSISVNGKLKSDLKKIKERLDEKFTVKAGGSEKFLQGLIISKDKDGVLKFFNEELEKLL